MTLEVRISRPNGNGVMVLVKNLSRQEVIALSDKAAGFIPGKSARLKGVNDGSTIKSRYKHVNHVPHSVIRPWRARNPKTKNGTLGYFKTEIRAAYCVAKFLGCSIKDLKK